MLVRIGTLVAFALLLSHLLSGTSWHRILFVDGALFSLLAILYFLILRDYFMKPVAYITLILATIGLFFLCYTDQENKVIINMFFIFLPPFISILYQHIPLILTITSLSCMSFLTNVLQKPAIVFYEGYPTSYNVYLIAFFMAIALVGVVQSKALRRLADENERKQQQIEEENRQTAALLQTKECVQHAISTFSQHLAEMMQQTNAIGLETESAFGQLGTSFHQTVSNMQQATKSTLRMNEELTTVKTIATNMQQAITTSDKSIQEGHEATRKLTNLFFDIQEKAGENARVTLALTKTSNEIERVMSLLQTISKQINLLALNASIEASRVGLAGKGFAVIAQEIKNLAVQAGTSTEQIAQTLQDLQEKANLVHVFSIQSQTYMQQGNLYTQEAIASFASIVTSNEAIKHHDVVLREKIEQVYRATNTVVNHMQQTNTITEESHTTLLELSELVHTLVLALQTTAHEVDTLVQTSTT